MPSIWKKGGCFEFLHRQIFFAQVQWNNTTLNIIIFTSRVKAVTTYLCCQVQCSFTKRKTYHRILWTWMQLIVLSAWRAFQQKLCREKIRYVDIWSALCWLLGRSSGAVKGRYILDQLEKDCPCGIRQILVISVDCRFDRNLYDN